MSLTSSVSSIVKNKLVLFTLVAYGVTAYLASYTVGQALVNSLYYLKEMLFVMPVIFMVTVLIDVWVKKETIIKHLGRESGGRGIAFSVFLGSLSAGPIYAAFPICKMLLAKGASVTNIVVILSSWAVIKVPMLANEARFLGVKFMALRWVLSVVIIYLMAKMMSLLVSEEDVLKNNSIENPLVHKAFAREVIVNQAVCIGCGLCEKKLPDVFKMNNKKAQVLQSSLIPCDDERFKLLCPVGAITC